MNPKFRQFPCEVTGESSSQVEETKKRDAGSLKNETSYPHQEFLKAMIEQQKFLQQQELEQQQVRPFSRFHRSSPNLA